MELNGLYGGFRNDNCCGVRQQSVIPDDSEVWITTDREPVRGRVTSSTDTPRSYNVGTPTGKIHRNCHQLQNRKQRPMIMTNLSDSEPEREPPKRIVTRSQTGTAIQPPDSLNLRGEMWKDTLTLHSCGCVYFLCLYDLMSELVCQF